MTRAITFPKTSTDTWTNRETGVQIIRYFTGSYGIMIPAQTEKGSRWAGSGYGTWIAAHRQARHVVADVRREIAKAYDGATEERSWPEVGNALAWKRNKAWTGTVSEVNFPCYVTVDWDNGTGVTGTDYLTLKEFERDWRIVHIY